MSKRSRIKSLIISFSLLSSALGADPANATALIELAPFFNGYTDACFLGNEIGRTFISWLHPLDDKGSLGTKPALPLRFAAALGDPVAVNREDHWHYTVPVKAATFNGVKTVAIERWSGKDNGISGFAIVFDAPAAVVNAAFKRVKFTSDEHDVRAILYFDKATGKSSLLCDSSD